MLNLVAVQDQIFAHLDSSIPQDLFEQAIPDADTVRKVSGKIVPYVAVQFAGLSERGTGATFDGVRTFDYDLSIQVQVVASKPEIARKILFGNVYDAMIGLKFDWIGEIRPTSLGGIFPITASNGATEAYQAASGFVATLQLSDL